jgi:hypothetical protein
MQQLESSSVLCSSKIRYRYLEPIPNTPTLAHDLLLPTADHEPPTQTGKPLAATSPPNDAAGHSRPNYTTLKRQNAQERRQKWVNDSRKLTVKRTVIYRSFCVQAESQSTMTSKGRHTHIGLLLGHSHVVNGHRLLGFLVGLGWLNAMNAARSLIQHHQKIALC